MTKSDLFDIFSDMFPQYAEYVVRYRKFGSRMLSLEMANGEKFCFLYMAPDNWTFGTTLWRKRPAFMSKQKK